MSKCISETGSIRKNTIQNRGHQKKYNIRKKRRLNTRTPRNKQTKNIKNCKKALLSPAFGNLKTLKVTWGRHYLLRDKQMHVLSPLTTTSPPFCRFPSSEILPKQHHTPRENACPKECK